MEISAPSTSRRRPALAAGRSRFVSLGDAKLGGIIGIIGLVLTLIGVVIAFLSWQGDERERAGSATSTPAASASSTTVSPSASASVPATATAPATTDSRGPRDPKPTRVPGKPAAGALSYSLEAIPVTARSVEVTIAPTGQAVAGKTYWFMVEVNWGDGNTDYYPRRRVVDQAATFDISIPPDARTDVVRTGRVYALDEGQSADAEVRLARQGSTTDEEDFFAEQTGRAVSNGERLPF